MTSTTVMDSSQRIPIGAGLGGGSSNAATFLLGMKKLYRLKISRRELLALGKKLGADVPFFLYNVNQAIGSGRGDRIRPRPSKARQWFILVLSSKGLATKKVYGSLAFVRPADSLTKINRAATLLCTFLEGKNFDSIPRLLANDLEPPAFRLRPSLRSLVTHFEKRGVLAARMTGSGPTVFAIFSQLREAKRLALPLQRAFPAQKIIICHTQ